MTIIHMETEQVRELISRMDRATSEFLEQTESLRSVGPTLSNAWEGESATEFIADMNELARNYQAQAQALDTLARRLSRELDEWEQADADFSGSNFVDYEVTVTFGSLGFWGIPFFMTNVSSIAVMTNPADLLQPRQVHWTQDQFGRAQLIFYNRVYNQPISPDSQSAGQTAAGVNRAAAMPIPSSSAPGAPAAAPMLPQVSSLANLVSNPAASPGAGGAMAQSGNQILQQQQILKTISNSISRMIGNMG